MPVNPAAICDNGNSHKESFACRGKSKSGRWERAKAESAWSEQKRKTLVDRR